jgi:hypothetical protein
MKYEQLEKCYETVKKQRDESEVKVKELVSWIEDGLWPQNNRTLEIVTIKKLKKIGV